MLGLLHTAADREDVPINVRVSRADRSSIEQIESLKVPTGSGQQVSLGELTHVEKTTIDTSIYRKNMQRVVYITGDVGGR